MTTASLHAVRRRHSCPSWCSDAARCADEHASAPDLLVPQHDAVLVTVRALAWEPDDSHATTALVSLGLEQLELDDKDTVELLPAEARALAAALLRFADRTEEHAR